MMSRPRVRAVERRPVETIPALAALLMILLSLAMIFASRRAWPQTMEPRGQTAALARPHGPSQADVLECSQWATTATAFNPGSSKLAPSWGEPKPSASSARARYNRWMGLCLGQREPRAN
jgi:hypothetical protein